MMDLIPENCEDCLYWLKLGECFCCEDAHCMWDNYDVPVCYDSFTNTWIKAGQPFNG
jgi:hypothetical protein